MSKLEDIINVVYQFQNRGIGKTHAAIMHAKEIGATLVCVNRQHAREIASEFGINTVGLESFNADKFRGSKKPVVFDPDALFAAMMGADRDINSLQNINQELRKEIENLKTELAGEDA